MHRRQRTACDRPLAGKDRWPAVKAFGAAVAQEMVSAAPEAYVATMSKAKRTGKIFIDYFRNDYTATAIADYGVRARPGAPVAVPLAWEELKGLEVRQRVHDEGRAEAAEKPETAGTAQRPGPPVMTTAPPPTSSRIRQEPDRFGRFCADLGPGLITGCADDDPSGISTYSVAGAAFGYAPAVDGALPFPLMTAVQLMCARLGMVTGRGLAGVIRRHYPRWVLWGACALLVIANVINIARRPRRDGPRRRSWSPASFRSSGLPIFGVTIVALPALVVLPPDRAHLQVADAGAARLYRARPSWRMSTGARRWRRRSCRMSNGRAHILSVLVGILGTTISPYLFFWQAAQEVEEERAQGRNSRAAQGRHRRGAPPSARRTS